MIQRAPSVDSAAGGGLLFHLPLVPLCAAAGILLLAGLPVALVMRPANRRPHISLQTRVRWRMWPGPGFARRRWMLWRRYGRPAARRVARRGRPSLSRRDRWLGPWPEYASFVGWAPGWLRPPRVFSTFEQVRLVIAPPQKGKSAAAAGNIIDDPGPVIATSIRGDLIAATAGLRQKTGRIHVFNPEGVGHYGSTITWNPVDGCQHFATAARRAGYLIEGTSARGLDESSFWQDQASMLLAALMHAAALAGGTMRHVHEWITDEDPQPVEILAAHPGAADPARRQIRRYLDLPDRTRAGVYATVNAAIRFMQDPAIAGMLCPDGPGSFDIRSFLHSRDTLYLVASDAKHTPVPPIFTALIAEITWQARLAGGATGRLDPPLFCELDEVANTAPIPAAAWATWAAGSGVCLRIYAQAFAQLAERWGQNGAETIWQASDMKIIYAGSSEPGLATRIEQGCGPVRLRGPDDIVYGPGGQRHRRPTWATEPALPAAVLLQLPPGRAVVLQGGSLPVIVRTERYWKRPDAKRAGAAALPPVTQPIIPAPMPELLHQPAVQPAQLDDLAARRFARHQAAASPQEPPRPTGTAAATGWPYPAPHREDPHR